MNSIKSLTKDFKKYTKSNYNIYPSDSYSVDVYSKLFENRIIFLNTDLDEHSANLIKAQLLYLDSIDNTKDIKLYIDSGGGNVYTSMGIVDTMDFITSDVETVNIGLAASMAAVILCYGQKGKRKSLKRSRTMIHQPLSGMEGQATDLEISTKEVLSLKKDLLNIIAEKSGKSIKQVNADCERDYWMTSNEAKKYGLIDIVL